MSNVDSPEHYKGGDIEVIDVIEGFGLDFCLGNVVKYVLRASRKGGVEDLEKAKWYLSRCIARNSDEDDSTEILRSTLEGILAGLNGDPEYVHGDGKDYLELLTELFSSWSSAEEDKNKQDS